MRLTKTTHRLATPLTIALLALATGTQAATQTTATHDKKSAQSASVKKAGTPTRTAHRAEAPARKSSKKASPARQSTKAADKPEKALTEAKAVPAKPSVPPEVTRKIATLEETNKALETKLGEVTQTLAALSQRHEELKTRVDNPPPMPKPEVPAGPLVLTGLLGALLGLGGSLAAGAMKGRQQSRPKEEEMVPFPAEPVAVRQEPTVS